MISEDIEVKDKTLTKDDIEQYTKSPSEVRNIICVKIIFFSNL